MDLILSPTSEHPALIIPESVPFNSSSQVGTEASLSQASKSIFTSPTAQDHPSTTYQVSIDMLCTSAQLQAIIISMAGAGTLVIMKIEPKL